MSIQTAARDDLAQAMPAVARDLLGEPNKHLSKPDDWRYGTNGSLSVIPEAGKWFDHEQNTGGGVLDLISRHAGGTRAEAAQWLKDRGYLSDDQPKQKARIVKTYDYTTEMGELLFQVCRMDPKSFRQRQPDSRGGWSWSVKGLRRVPYRLAELVKADPAALVYVVEGEKDADRLAALGLVATTNAGGAGKWPAEFAGFFAGRRVAILPDNDEAGRDHAGKVLASLKAKGVDAKIVTLPNLPDKGDVSNWLDLGGSADALQGLVDRAKDEGKGTAPRASAKASPSKIMADDLGLVADKSGRALWNTANAVEILTEHEAWKGVFGFNEFTRRRVILKPIPGAKTGHGRNLEDDDTTCVVSWFNRNGFPKATAAIAVPAIHAASRRNTFDPLKDYLRSLSWDGAKRLDGWLTTYCGAEATDYTREVGRRWLISAVARAVRPGCKADHMLVLEGDQGARKSSALAALAGEEWFSDALPPMNTKDSSSYLRGKWIVEVAELEAMRREMDAVKAFISRQIENYRPAYGREEVDEPRRCIFAGTTNKDAWLRDETGGRRFWPVKVGHIDLDAIKRDREQIWAEAVAAYRAGERWWLEGSAEVAARDEQATRMADDPWLEVVADAVQGRSEITIREVFFSMGILPADMSRKDSDRVAALLKRLDWKRGGRVTSGALKGQAVFTSRN